ncbi:hypothetical protein [Azohydromonas aeria]|uniref:hypothetical protein n=1 Tax=Azohydromonas aeria TaxID=2590212 RepID=UPI0012FC5573|nr:hypothetical protein [Azohydromonas aeria]
MKVTVILKGLSQAFYAGSATLPAFDAMDPAAKFQCCRELVRAGNGRTMQIGSGQMRDAAELNQLLCGPVAISCTVEPRRGYRLAVFDIRKA